MVSLAMVLAAAQGNKGFRAINVIALSTILFSIEAEGLDVPQRQFFRHAMDFGEGGQPSEVLHQETEGRREITSSHRREGEGLGRRRFGDNEKDVAGHGPAKPVVVSPHEEIGEGELRSNRWVGVEDRGNVLPVLEIERLEIGIARWDTHSRSDGIQQVAEKP
jgi:hypothetical protein